MDIFRRLNMCDLTARASVDVARRIQYAFEKIARQFGFQPDSLANQHEHVLLLLANAKREALDSWDQVCVRASPKERESESQTSIFAHASSSAL